MRFRVRFTVNAETSLQKYFRRAFAEAPQTAIRWLERIQNAIESLANFPRRCVRAPENGLRGLAAREIRQLIFGKARGAFRILFEIADDEVRILLIRRGSQKRATAKELFGE